MDVWIEINSGSYSGCMLFFWKVWAHWPSEALFHVNQPISWITVRSHRPSLSKKWLTIQAIVAQIKYMQVGMCLYALLLKISLRKTCLLAVNLDIATTSKKFVFANVFLNERVGKQNMTLWFTELCRTHYVLQIVSRV